MDFLALDFETANESLASICQVGVANFGRSDKRDDFSTLIDPESYFAGINVSIHGIDSDDVIGAPIFPDVYPALADMLSGCIVVSHTAFDRTALYRAAERYELPKIECRWLDSARVVRRTWTSCAREGYGLSSIAEKLGITFRHHDALEDAKAAGKVLQCAIKESGIGIEEWLAQSLKPIGGPIGREGNPAGAVYGEHIVFTGALELPRREAAAMAAKIGFTVSDCVSVHTSVLVIGDQDISRLRPGEVLSTKRRKAEALIASGSPLRIISESDFLALFHNESEVGS